MGSIVLAAATAAAAYFVLRNDRPGGTFPGYGFTRPSADPRSVRVETLLRPTARAGEVGYAELTGKPPEELIVASEAGLPDQEHPPQSYVDAYTWDAASNRWRSIFDARMFNSSGPNGDFPAQILADEWRSGVDQSVAHVDGIDFDADGAEELVIGVSESAGTSGSFTVWILSVAGGAQDRADFFHLTDVGGALAEGSDRSSLVVESLRYAERDPGCCPSLRLIQVIDWDDARSRFRVISEIEEPAE